MALILAIEPDVTQAVILRQVISELVPAELCLVDSKAAAISALKKNVPALILISAVLPAHEEQELVAYLRTTAELAHQQTLMIPRLAAVYTATRGGPVRRAYSRWAGGQGDYVEGSRLAFSGGGGLLSTALDYRRPRTIPLLQGAKNLVENCEQVSCHRGGRMIRRKLVRATCAAACALGAGMLSAQEARSYAWYVELVAVDQAAKTMTVTAQTREAVNRYVENYEPGDKLMLTWVPVEGEADTIIYTPKYEVMRGIEDGYILPAEFVSADTDNNSLTFRTSVPDGMLASIAGVQAGQWIRVTSPMHQPEEIAVLTSAVAAERPNLQPLPMPEPPPRR